MYSLIFYSHSDYADAWSPMFGQTDKYFDNNCKKYLFVNSGDYDVPAGWEVLEYDDNLPYQRRVHRSVIILMACFILPLRYLVQDLLICKLSNVL